MSKLSKITIGLIDSDYKNIFISEMGNEWSIRNYKSRIFVPLKTNKIIIPDFERNELNIALKLCDILIFTIYNDSINLKNTIYNDDEWIYVYNKNKRRKINTVIDIKDIKDSKIFNLTINNNKIVHNDQYILFLEKIEWLENGKINNEIIEDEVEDNDEEENIYFN